MKPPHSLTDTELLQYADEHLQYEVDMLTWSASILAFLVAHKEEGYLPWAMNNGLLSSFALHARNLVNFLFSRTKGKDRSTDVIVEDYVDSGIGVSSLVSMTPLLEEALTKANKQAAHLTLERIQYEQAGKEWEFIELTKQIRVSLSSVIPHIPRSRMSDSLRQKLGQPDIRIPIVDIKITKSPTGAHVGVSFSLRIGPDGKTIEDIPT